MKGQAHMSVYDKKNGGDIYVMSVMRKKAGNYTHQNNNER